MADGMHKALLSSNDGRDEGAAHADAYG